MTSRFVLQDALDDYFRRHPGERAVRERIAPLLAMGARLLHRDCLPGHLTASAWIVDEAGQETLLLYHRKLQRWLQPGGHPDGDHDLPGAALREAREETGLTSLRLSSEDIFDFGVPAIPARPDMPAHDHLDVRFVIRADRSEPIVESAESAGARWVPLAEVAALTDDPGLARMVARTAALSTSAGTAASP